MRSLFLGYQYTSACLIFLREKLFVGSCRWKFGQRVLEVGGKCEGSAWFLSFFTWLLFTFCSLRFFGEFNQNWRLFGGQRGWLQFFVAEVKPSTWQWCWTEREKEKMTVNRGATKKTLCRSVLTASLVVLWGAAGRENSADSGGQQRASSKPVKQNQGSPVLLLLSSFRGSWHLADLILSVGSSFFYSTN